MQPRSSVQTKIRPPQFRADLIARDELERHLGEALTHRRLVLLVAPAGYGKTAALSRQLGRLAPACSSAWVTLGEDDDLQRLIACLAEALEPFDPPWRMTPEALAERALQKGALRGAVAVLLAALAATEVRHGVIALDDLHAVSDHRVFEFLDLLLDGLPDNWTLAIASRTDPPVGLARLRARRELAEFRQSALSFSLPEVEQLWRAVTGEDNPAMAQSLHERTHGWAAGLSLSLNILGSRRASTLANQRQSRRYMFDYLASEVLAQMPEALREFLLRCSVLAELRADRCAAVSGNSSAAELLEDIVRHGLFVSIVDDEELTLRLHDLFRDFLNEQLRKRDPEQVSLLLRRAAEGETDPLRKVPLLLRAGAWTEAEQAFADGAPSILAKGGSTQVMRLIEHFPAERRDDSPVLDYMTGLCAWHQFEDFSVQPAMHRAAEGFDRRGQPARAQVARAAEALALVFLGRLEDARSLALAIRSSGTMEQEAAALTALVECSYCTLHGPPLGPARHLAELLDILSAGAAADLWFRCMPRLYMLIGRAGISGLLRRFVKAALAAAGDTDESVLAHGRLLEAYLLVWQGDLGEAGIAIHRVEAQIRWLGQPRSLQVPLARLWAAYHAMRGDCAGVRAVIEPMMADVARPNMHPDWVVAITCLQVRMAAAVDEWEVVQRGVRSMEEARRNGLGRHSSAVDTLKARLALHEGRTGDALPLLREVVKISADADFFGLDASARIYLAVAELRAGDAQAAWQALAPLVANVRAYGDLGDVLLTGVAILTELAAGPWESAAPSEALAVLGQWRDLARRLRADAAAPREAEAGSGAQLSTRELEVLALIAAGQSNKLIARALDLSPHTVKRHVARILERLDLSSRGQAAAWYAENVGSGGS